MALRLYMDGEIALLSQKKVDGCCCRPVLEIAAENANDGAITT
jgi:hypothetical protein